MPAFLKEITPFYGTKSKNKEGQTLEQFLEQYNPKKYDTPCMTIDILIFCTKKYFTSITSGLKILMIQRKNHPNIGYWALPGGFVEMEEDLEAAARRELKEETNLDHIVMEQLYTWGDYKRDPRTRIITTSYIGLIKEETSGVKAMDDAADIMWADISFKKIGDAIVEVDGIEKLREMYHLKLMESERNIKLMATVFTTKNRKEILKNIQYEIFHSEGIAFDHAKIIVQGLLHLQSLL